MLSKSSKASIMDASNTGRMMTLDLFDGMDEDEIEEFLKEVSNTEREKALKGAFQQAFDTARRENKFVDNEKIAMLNYVYRVFSKLAEGHGVANMRLIPETASGSVSIKVDSAEFDSETAERLAAYLKDCATFSVDPLADGKVNVGVTIAHVLKSTED